MLNKIKVVLRMIKQKQKNNDFMNIINNLIIKSSKILSRIIY